MVLTDYNVIVGYNASGKTNIIRAVELLAGKNEESPLRYALDDIRLAQDARFDKSDRSTIVAEIELSQFQSRLFLETLFRTPLAGIQHIAPKRITVIVSWPATVEPWSRPDFILIMLENGFAILRKGNYVYLLMHLHSIADSTQQLIQHIESLDVVRNGSSMIQAYESGFRFSPSSILQISTFRTKLIECSDVSSFFRLKEGPTKKDIAIECEIRPIDYRQHTGAPHYEAEIANYCSPRLLDGITVSILLLVRIFMNRELSILRDEPVDYDTLASHLYRLEKTEEFAPYQDALAKGFANLFDDAQFKIVQPDPKVSKYKIHIIEKNGIRSNLEQSASGYYEALRIFSTALFENNNVVFLDEPILHLHPTKIKLLARTLMSLANTQVIVVTHSPFFVDTDLFAAGRSIHYVKREQSSKLSSKPQGFKTKLKSHLFEPGIFFSRFNLFVEGPSDASALIAISDYFHSIFETKDILVTYVQGKGDVDNYYQIVKKYAIPYLFMLDSDYRGKAKPAVKLNKKLEDELRRLGWKGARLSSADPAKVYDFVFDTMQQDKEKVKKTKLAQVFNLALESVGADITKIWM